MKLKIPDAPSNIKWENLEISSCEKRCRKLLAWILILCILILSALVVWHLKSIKGNIPTDEECNELDVDPEDEFEVAKFEYKDDTDQTYCWCKR